MTTDTSERPRRRHRGWRIFGWTGGVILAIVLVLAVVGSITPWPSAMLIRAVFTQGGEEAAAEMKRHVPDTPIGATRGIPYGAADDPDTTMDVFTNAEAGDVLPTIVWVHGGAWIAGSSDNVDPYMQILASEGYTAVALNYSLGPEQVYPHGGQPAQHRPEVHRRQRRRARHRQHADRARRRLGRCSARQSARGPHHQ